MALTDLYNPHADLSEAAAALTAALDRGVRVLHTAGHYGDGAAFRMVREVAGAHPAAAGLRVITKVDGAPERLVTGAEGARTAAEAMGRTSLDAQLVESWPGLPRHTSLEDILTDLESHGPRHDLLAGLRAEGVIRRVGIEAYHPGHVRRAVESGELDFVVADMSVIRQVVPPAEVPERIASGAVELVAIRPLAGGWLTERYRTLDDFAADDNRREWYHVAEQYRAAVAKVLERHGIGMLEAALRFLHSLPYLPTIVVGMRTLEQVGQVLDERHTGPLPVELYRELTDLFPQPVTVEFD